MLYFHRARTAHQKLEITLAWQATEGQLTKTEMVCQYLNSSRSLSAWRLSSIVFSTMQEDLSKECKVIMKQWAKQKEQVERVLGATVGMYGDLQDVAGKSLQ